MRRSSALRSSRSRSPRARDAKEMGSVDARVRVEEIHVGAEHLLDRNHRERTTGHGQQSLGVARQLELGEMRFAPRTAAEHDGEREPEVGQVGQRMSRAQRHRERRELGVDLVAAAGAKAGLLLGRQIAPAQDAHAERLGRFETLDRAARLRLDDRGDLLLHTIEPVAHASARRDHASTRHWVATRRPDAARASAP